MRLQRYYFFIALRLKSSFFSQKSTPENTSSLYFQNVIAKCLFLQNKIAYLHMNT